MRKFYEKHFHHWKFFNVRKKRLRRQRIVNQWLRFCTNHPHQMTRASTCLLWRVGHFYDHVSVFALVFYWMMPCFHMGTWSVPHDSSRYCEWCQRFVASSKTPWCQGKECFLQGMKNKYDRKKNHSQMHRITKMFTNTIITKQAKTTTVPAHEQKRH